jgi:hypothetical protein
LKELKRTTKKLGQNSRSLGQGSNPAISWMRQMFKTYCPSALLAIVPNLSNACSIICFFEILLRTNEWRLIDMVSS